MKQENKDLIDRIFNSQQGINQVKDEIIGLLSYLENYEIKTFLEIGTQNGGTLWLFSSFMPENSLSISIDIAPCNYMPVNGREIHLINSDSGSQEALDKTISILHERKVDFLFIDGDHKQAERDFTIFISLVRSGGIVVFHDINPKGPIHNVGTVPAFWNSIKSNYKYAEFMANNSDGFGIGLIHIP